MWDYWPLLLLLALAIVLPVAAVTALRRVSRSLRPDPRAWAVRNGQLDAEEFRWFYYGVLERVAEHGVLDVDGVDQAVVAARLKVAQLRGVSPS